jgi:hypothetical protein
MSKEERAMSESKDDSKKMKSIIEEEFHFDERLTKIEKMTDTLYELILEQNQMISKISIILDKID